jgi:hypothetical protein
MTPFPQTLPFWIALFFVLAFLPGAAAAAQGRPSASASAVFQYEVLARSADGKEITALLWVPPKADRIRGVLVGGRTLMEEQFVQDPLIRQTCADEELAIVYFAPFLDALFDYKAKGSGALLQRALDDLAATSGYKEIAVAPLFPYGHSVSSLFASRVVAWAPQRCFGALMFKGGVSLPPFDPAASLAGVPLLAVKGQYEEFGPGPDGFLRDFEDRQTSWKNQRRDLLALRAKDPRHLVSLLVEPGATHFAWSEPVARYVAEFLRTAARRRIPSDWPLDAHEPVRCAEVSPESGALTDGNIGDFATTQRSPAASFRKFTGDPVAALWHLNLALARRNDSFHAGLTGKRPQFVSFADPATGAPLPVGSDLRLRFAPQWVGPDTFRVAGAFWERVPDKYPKTLEPVGHAPGPVRFRAYGGAVEQVGTDTFRVALNGHSQLRAELLAYHSGDRTYRYAEQQARIGFPEQLKEGRDQTITFDPVPPLHSGGRPVQLRAASDSGLPVRFYVEAARRSSTAETRFVSPICRAG